MSYGMKVRAYESWDHTGLSKAYTMSTSARYRKVSSLLLIDDGLFNNVAATRMYRNSTADSNLIGFFTGGLAVGTDYTGSFIHVRLASDAPNFVSDNNWGGTYIHSMLLVRTHTGIENRISVRDNFLDFAKNLIDDQLPGFAHRNGDPIFTWEMWPQGISYLDSHRRYLKFYQRLRIKPSVKTYDATMTYHVYLRLNAHGIPRATGARWAYWIEGGALTNKIEEELKPAVKNGLKTVENLINEFIADATGGVSFKDLFYLPGHNTNPDSLLVLGNTDDDVTIVFVS